MSPREGRFQVGVHAAIFDAGIETDYDTGRLSTPEFLAVVRTTLRLQASDAEIGRAWSDIFTPNQDFVAAGRTSA